MSLSGVALFAAGLVAVAALAGCSDGDTGAESAPSPTDSESAASESPPPSSSTPTPTKVPDAPHQVGDCLDESLGKVPCTKPHKYEAIVVGTLPTTMPKRWPTSVTTIVGPECNAALPDYTGSEGADLTRLTLAITWAQEPDWVKGERWWSCLTYDVTDAPLTSSVRDALRDGPGNLVSCIVGSPADSGPTRYVPCSRPHRSQAVDTVRLAEPGAPLPKRLGTLAISKCLARIRTTFGADLGGATYPSPEQWRAGDTTAVCYVVTDKPTTGLRG